MRSRPLARRGGVVFAILALHALGLGPGARGDDVVRVPLGADRVRGEAAWQDAGGLIDEEAEAAGDPPRGRPSKPWATDWSRVGEFPMAAVIDLGEERPLAALWVYDVHDVGTISIQVGEPGAWRAIAEYETRAFESWVKLPLDVVTRRLRIERRTPSAQLGEIALRAYSAEAWKALCARKAEEARAAEARQAALARAEEEAAHRPRVDLGPPWGILPLVEEVDCASSAAPFGFAEYPVGASRVERVLDRPCRVLAPRPGEASFLSWRVGRFKCLKPGSVYLLVLDYPEDAPRSQIVLSGGSETARGFHTGDTVGDALRPKYVGSNPESLRIPLSGRFETWKQCFSLHDRFPARGFIRGAGPRPLLPEDGFPVTIAQFALAQDPTSRGLAISRIRLFEVPDPSVLDIPAKPLPEGIPRRHIFWREEMADGVIDSEAPEERGIARPIDWYRAKARLMRTLGIDTFAKDLLEFGACQHWDSTLGGGHDWVFFAERHKDLWGEIVRLMGREGFSVLPYYEYAGSRGYHGLGEERRAKPLTRDDAFTHIAWIEQANADITDPATLADFRKILDATVIRFRGEAPFLGAWIRPRSQLPMGFGAGALARFADEVRGGEAVTREGLRGDAALLEAYRAWWFRKRRAFLEGVRDHLRRGLEREDAVVLFTADPSEPGPAFPVWEPRIVTDERDAWMDVLASLNAKAERPMVALDIREVVRRDLYLEALLSPPLDWGGWEVSHASPAADPALYRDVPGVLLSHGFHRAYSVESPRTLDLFRGPSGLALVRHHTLNENMLHDREDKDLLGYFVADFERAGPYSMLEEVRAVANGDPWWLGYLVGSNFQRGFPEAARAFHSAFLALPALPGRRVSEATGDPEVVVRAVTLERHGTWLSIANTGFLAKSRVAIALPVPGRVEDASSGAELPTEDGGLRLILDLPPASLRAIRIR